MSVDGDDGENGLVVSGKVGRGDHFPPILDVSLLGVIVLVDVTRVKQFPRL